MQTKYTKTKKIKYISMNMLFFSEGQSTFDIKQFPIEIQRQLQLSTKVLDANFNQTAVKWENITGGQWSANLTARSLVLQLNKITLFYKGFMQKFKKTCTSQNCVPQEH
ncbi:unnamed protein product [Ilex paraguariensis]|uniref:Uncharacterized protein n=1 Tax=Ilex paraguariensis TaxID=185542 RepID=A0ABC8UGS3_9AQUA